MYDDLPENIDEVRGKLAEIMNGLSSCPTAAILAKSLGVEPAAKPVGAQVVSYDGETVVLQFTGACTGCSGAGGTEASVASQMRHEWPDLEVETLTV